MDTNRKVEIYMDKACAAWIERQNTDSSAAPNELFPYMRTMDFINDF